MFTGRICRKWNQIADPLLGNTTIVFDANNRIIQQTDPRGATTQYDYDANGRTTSVTNPLGDVTSYEYDVKCGDSVVDPKVFIDP